jgi:hypothetical protein
MPTVLRQFPQVDRTGTQRTGWVKLAAFDFIHLQGQASVATLSDPTNAVDFVVLASPSGTDADPLNQELQRVYWTGGTYPPKGGGANVPREVDVQFNLQARNAGWFVALQAWFHSDTGIDKTINMGATLTGLP